MISSRVVAEEEFRQEVEECFGHLRLPEVHSRMVPVAACAPWMPRREPCAPWRTCIGYRRCHTGAAYRNPNVRLPPILQCCQIPGRFRLRRLLRCVRQWPPRQLLRQPCQWPRYARQNPSVPVRRFDHQFAGRHNDGIHCHRNETGQASCLCPGAPSSSERLGCWRIRQEAMQMHSRPQTKVSCSSFSPDQGLSVGRGETLSHPPGHSLTYG